MRIPRCPFPAAQSTRGNCRLTPRDATEWTEFPEREITVNISRAAQRGRLRPQRSRSHASGITLREQAAMTISDASTGRERAGSDAEADRQPVTRAARAARGPGRRAALPRTVAFWLVAGVLFLLFFAAAAPSPLYGVYQAQWRFSATTLTAVFAAYALLLLVTLLVFGSASDYLGRRRVILAGLAMAAGACGLFLAARGAGLLFAARALHGAAVGTASSALGAALIDLRPEGSGIAPVATTGASLLG